MDKRSLWQRKALKGSRLRLLIRGVLAAFLVVDLFGPARHLRGGSFSFTIHLPGLRSSVHSRIPFPGKK